MSPTIQNILPILKAAGKVILEIYNNDKVVVDYKEDHSPLTQADTAANALIENGAPVFGGIYVPVQDTFYFGEVSKGAFMKKGNGELQPISVNGLGNELIAVGSKSHAKEEESNFYENMGVSKAVSVGSSLKFCMIASGQADIYFRSGPTMEWDTAAGHAIVKAAGGEVYKDLGCKEVFTYNKESLLNGPFLCASSPEIVKQSAR